MKKIKKGYIIPSSAMAIKPSQVKFYKFMDKPPEVGDVVYGAIQLIGEHSSLENVSGRIHFVHNGSRALFVYGNRYSPSYYEGLLPGSMKKDVDLMARSGLIGTVKTKNALVKDPTRVKVLGYVCDEQGQVLNTRNFPVIKPKQQVKKGPRSKMILCCGTSMNCGKSLAAAACCWALTTMGYDVRASKVTGTASLKDILLMNDKGAYPFADFTYLGYPSTYLLAKGELLHIFNQMDLKYANNPKNYWVVELADGILQRETALLLATPEVKSRLHKLIFCASDAFGIISGLDILKERFALTPDGLSGVCSSSPLHIRELSEFTDIPVFNSAHPDLNQLVSILI